MKAKAVSVLRSKRGLHRGNGAKPSAVELTSQTTNEWQANTMATFILRVAKPVERQKSIQPLNQHHLKAAAGCQSVASLRAGGSSQGGRAIFRLPGRRRTWRPIGKPAGAGLVRLLRNAEVETGFILITRGNGQRQLGEDAHRPQHRPARAAHGWFGGHSHESSSLIFQPAATRVFLAASGESGRQPVSPSLLVSSGSRRGPKDAGRGKIIPMLPK